VFPGGTIDKEDCVPQMEELCYGIDRHEARNLLDNAPSAEKSLGAWVAAIRETFEEVGILLARNKDGSFVSFGREDCPKKLLPYRKSLVNKELGFDEFLRKKNLTMATDKLYYFSHWITPELLPIRYDVRFFLAEFPENQRAMHDGEELTEHVWVTPQEALEYSKKGNFNMILPTIMTIKELSRCKTIEDAINLAKRKRVEAILTKMIIDEENKIVEYMPDGRAVRNLPPSVKNVIA
jgi:8-oxo-dGTP pyrophosphatase MutT (NUDIX family)